MTTRRTTLGRAMVVVGVMVAAVAGLAVDARATYGARTTADEPQYLVTARSLGEDLDLDISDELEEGNHRDFHEIPLDPQTIELNDSGQRLSPHDPLLPMLLAAPMRVGGWVGAKLALAAIGGLTAAATLWVAVRRLAVSGGVAAVVVGGAFVTPPLTAYGTQVYPEMPAALATVIAVGALTGARVSPRAGWLAAASVVALPWLGVKYVPVAAVIAAWLALRLWRESRERLVTMSLALAAMGVVYLVVHRRVYGGWTVYASGDHFVDGELSVVGENADYVGRSRRLIGLLVDRGFGLIPWAPHYLLAPPALAAWARRRPPGWALASTAIAAGYATATWVALTMHGWWWPGRQLVVILPLVVIAMAHLVDHHRRLLVPFAVAVVLSVFGWLWLVVEASTDRLTLIVDFEDTGNWWSRTWRLAFPDHRRFTDLVAVGTAAWTVVVLAAGVLAWKAARPAASVPSPPPEPEPGAPGPRRHEEAV